MTGKARIKEKQKCSGSRRTEGQRAVEQVGKCVNRVQLPTRVRAVPMRKRPMIQCAQDDLNTLHRLCSRLYAQGIILLLFEKAI